MPASRRIVFAERLEAGPLLWDGAIGTQLYEVSGIVDGVYFMPQFGRYDNVLDILSGSKVMADRSENGDAVVQ